MKNPSVYIRNQVIANVLVNFFIAYYLSKHALEKLSYIPFEAPAHDPFHPNMAGDLLVGTFIMGVVLTLVITILTRMQLNTSNIDVGSIMRNSTETATATATAGKIKAVTTNKTIVKEGGLIERLPAHLLLRALVIGFMASLLMAFPVVAILDTLKIHALSANTYVFVHAIYCSLASAVLTVVVCKRAMLDSPRHSNAGALE